MSKNKSYKLPIIILITGCIAGSILGYTYSKFTSTTEFLLLNTGKNLVKERNSINSTNPTYKDIQSILADDYNLGINTTFESFGLGLSYDTSNNSYDFDLSLLGFEKGFVFENNPISFNAEDKEITEEQQEQLKNLQNYYKNQLKILFLNSEVSNEKYQGDEDFDRVLKYTIDSQVLTQLYTNYINELDIILTDKLLEDITLSSDSFFGFTIKDNPIKTILKNELKDQSQNYINEKFLSNDIVITFTTKNKNITRVNFDANSLNATLDFDAKNYLNSPSTLLLSFDDIVNSVITISPTFNNELWALDLVSYSPATPNTTNSFSCKWDLTSDVDNIFFSSNTNSNTTEKYFTISVSDTDGVVINSDNLEFFIMK